MDIIKATEEFLTHLLGKVNYILQVSPDHSEMKEYREWILSVKKRHA